MPVFERLNNRLRLTESGALLITHVRQTLNQHDRMRARIESLMRKRRSEVTIATTSGLAAGLLPRIVADFRAHHTNVKMTVRILPVGQIIASLASGESDLGLATGLSSDGVLETFATAVVQLGAVMASRHELAMESSIDLAACRSASFHCEREIVFAACRHHVVTDISALGRVRTLFRFQWFV